MKCQYCKKDFSDDVITIHETWCEGEQKEKKEKKVELPKEQIKKK